MLSVKEIYKPPNYTVAQSALFVCVCVCVCVCVTLKIALSVHKY